MPAPDGHGKTRPPGRLPPGGRVTRDEAGRVRDWFDLGAPPQAPGSFAPDDVARRMLAQHAAEFGWSSTLFDMRPTAILRTPGAFSVRFSQEHHSLPVDASEVVVNLYADSRVHSIYNQYRYRIPQSIGPEAARVDAVRAREIVARLTAMFRRREIGPARLIVHQYREHELRPTNRTARPRRARAAFVRSVRARLARRPRPREGAYLLVWELSVVTRQPFGRWRILVDATNGRVVDVFDGIAYATGTGKVFDPNPIVTSGDGSLSSSTPRSVLNQQRRQVSLQRLDPARGGTFRLDGTWAHMVDSDLPSAREPTSRTASFSYSSASRKFLNVMAYFHIDRFQQYLRTTLGLAQVAAFSVPVDPQAMEGGDASGSDGQSIFFGEGGVPDASDAMLILHEYGHVIQESTRVSSSTGNHDSGLSEGFPDFLAAVYYDDRHADPTQTRGKMFSWNANPTDHTQPQRTYDLPFRFDSPEWSSPPATLGTAYGRAAIWCSVMFELYRKLGGDAPDLATKRAARDLAIRLHVMATFGVPAQNATVTEIAQQLEAADAHFEGWRHADGLHLKVIHDTFARRGAPGYAFAAVDVYVFDGREGGYGSPDGLDAFGSVLWKTDVGNTPDVWTTTSSNAAPPAPPRAGHPAFLWVRVKNRGTATSPPITVRAFRAAAAPMIWPTDWVPLDAAMPSLGAPGVAPSPAPGRIVGPFTWVPAGTAAVSVLVIVDCAADRALTETLPTTAPVPGLDLVAFDNNIALKRLTVGR